MTISENLIKPPVTRAVIGEQTGLKGKELTAHIKSLKAGGGVHPNDGLFRSVEKRCSPPSLCVLRSSAVHRQHQRVGLTN